MHFQVLFSRRLPEPFKQVFRGDAFARELVEGVCRVLGFRDLPFDKPADFTFEARELPQFGATPFVKLRIDGVDPKEVSAQKDDGKRQAITMALTAGYFRVQRVIEAVFSEGGIPLEDPANDAVHFAAEMWFTEPTQISLNEMPVNRLRRSGTWSPPEEDKDASGKTEDAASGESNGASHVVLTVST